MRPSEALALHRTQIREIALRHRVSGVRVFGSVLRGDDVAGSDLDLLVDPTPATTLMDIGAIRFELKPTGSNQRGQVLPFALSWFSLPQWHALFALSSPARFTT